MGESESRNDSQADIRLRSFPRLNVTPRDFAIRHAGGTSDHNLFPYVLLYPNAKLDHRVAILAIHWSYGPSTPRASYRRANRATKSTKRTQTESFNITRPDLSAADFGSLPSQLAAHPTEPTIRVQGCTCAAIDYVTIEGMVTKLQDSLHQPRTTLEDV